MLPLNINLYVSYVSPPLMLCSYFAKRPYGQLTLPPVDAPELSRALKKMERAETSRKWRRASIVIQCAVRGRLAKKQRESLSNIDPEKWGALSPFDLPEKPASSTPRPGECRSCYCCVAVLCCCYPSTLR